MEVGETLLWRELFWGARPALGQDKEMTSKEHHGPNCVVFNNVIIQNLSFC